ncbi:MAG TPA: hypothetical protein VN345_20260 [Blastocatellia bacterium]|nr:hypothetical protein [Blastocatellia bacterium]
MDEANEMTETSAIQETPAQETPATASQDGRGQDYDPFAREYNVPWEEIERDAEMRGADDAGSAAQVKRAEDHSDERQTEAPEGAAGQEAAAAAEAGQGQTEAGATSEPGTADAQEKAAPGDYAAQIEQWGGAPIVELVKPLFTGITDLQSATANAETFVQAIGKFDPAVQTGLANAFYNSFKDAYAKWADADRGITPESWSALKQWQAGGGAALGTAPQFPQPGPDNTVVFHEPDGREVELDMENPLHREIYETRKERFEQAERQKADETRSVEERSMVAEQQRQQRVYEYASARDRAFTQAWDEAKPNYGPDPDLQFLADFARVYAQHIAGTNPEGLRLHNEAIRLAADGGTGAEAKAAKMDLLMRKDIKSALETIDKVVRRVAARQTAAQAGQPKLPPGAVRTGVIRQGAPPERGPVSRQPGRVSLDDPESFAAVHIPWPK